MALTLAAEQFKIGSTYYFVAKFNAPDVCLNVSKDLTSASITALVLFTIAGLFCLSGLLCVIMPCVLQRINSCRQSWVPTPVEPVVLTTASTRRRTASVRENINSLSHSPLIFSITTRGGYTRVNREGGRGDDVEMGTAPRGVVPIAAAVLPLAMNDKPDGLP